MEIYKTTGTILHAFDFKDYDKILTIFAEEEGLFKVIVKNANRPTNRLGKSTAPLTHAEFVYTCSKSDIRLCKEISVINYRLQLRSKLELLEAAVDITRTVSKSIIPNTTTPLLYQLLNIYLDELPKMHSPATLAESYKLKLLRHEGLLSFDDPEMFQQFTPQEIDLISILTYSRHLDELIPLQLSGELRKKITQFFAFLISN